MYTAELMEAGIQEKTISLLNKWLESHLRSMMKSAFLPKESQRFVFELGHSKTGKATYHVHILEGLEFIRSTAPRIFTDADELGFTFRDLSEEDQLLILAYFDPFMEFQDEQDWKTFLIQHGIRKKHKEYSIEALLRLQDLLQIKGIIKMAEGETLRGWSQIADYLDMSVPSAMKLAREKKLPCSIVGGTIVTTKARLDAWLEAQIDAHPYYKQREFHETRRRR